MSGYIFTLPSRAGGRAVEKSACTFTALAVHTTRTYGSKGSRTLHSTFACIFLFWLTSSHVLKSVRETRLLDLYTWLGTQLTDTLMRPVMVSICRTIAAPWCLHARTIGALVDTLVVIPYLKPQISAIAVNGSDLRRSVKDDAISSRHSFCYRSQVEFFSKASIQATKSCSKVVGYMTSWMSQMQSRDYLCECFVPAVE